MVKRIHLKTNSVKKKSWKKSFENPSEKKVHLKDPPKKIQSKLPFSIF